MTAYRVAIVADDTERLAGTAVVRIEGLTQWPPNASLRILPIDEAAVPPRSEGWPWGDIVPLRVTPTGTGLDVLLGPDVVGCAQLIPGTPVILQVAAANLELEARWPSLSPTVRRRATAVAMSAAQLLAAKAERDTHEQTVTARRRELAAFALKMARDGAESENAGVVAETAGNRRGGSGQLARLLPLRRRDTSQPDSPSVVPPNQTPPEKAATIAATITPSSNAAPTRQTSAQRSGARRWGFVSGGVTMALLIAAAALFGPPAWRPPILSERTIASSSDDQLAMADLQSMFKDVASAGAKSPLNKPAADVDIATALSLADHSLRGERTAEETEEAVFWLRRALAASFGGADVGWALTQLGTIYATPGTPQHNYVKAHTIWQLAAAQGDPVAHCFLGALYEHGLGVIKSRPIALQHYKTAQSLGGCPSADDAVTRLSE